MKRFIKILILLFICVPNIVLAQEQKIADGKFTLLSSAFGDKEEIPSKYACHGGDVNPPLEFVNAPPKTKSFALTIQDLDAKEGVWVHWVVYNIPPTKTKIEANQVPGYEALNDFGKYNYSGPCPVDEKVHRFVFQVYAINDILPVDDGMTIKDLEKAMKGHIVAKSGLTATFRKPVW